MRRPRLFENRSVIRWQVEGLGMDVRRLVILGLRTAHWD